MRAIRRLLKARAHSRFTDPISHPDAQFCEPALRVGVEFMDMTDDGYLLDAAFKRFTDELTREL